MVGVQVIRKPTIRETQKLIDSMTQRPPPGQIARIDHFIRQLLLHNIWQRLDVLQIYKTHTSAAALLNWINPGTFNATLVNSPTFTANTGIQGDGATSYINTGFAPNAGVKFTQNDAYIATEADAGTATGAMAFGACEDAGGNFAGVLFENDSPNMYLRMNGDFTSDLDPGTNSGVVAYCALERTGSGTSNAFRAYRNAVSLGTNSSSSAARTDSTVMLGAYNDNGTVTAWFDLRYRLFAAGASMGTARHAAFHRLTEIHLNSY